MLLQLSNISKSFGAQDVLTSATLTVRSNEKIALVGRNGSGKTTLLKMITSEEEPDQGDVFKSDSLRVGYLAQIAFSSEDRTVYEELLDEFRDVISLEKKLEEQAALLAVDSSEQQLDRYERLQNEFESRGGYDYEHELRSVFMNSGFEERELKKKISEFSSGQRTRIALVKLLLSKPDLLLLDEPTNHLDVKAIEWLEGYISRYPKAVILVSHDRMFLEHTATEIVELEFGKTTRYPGSYTHYLSAKEEFLAKNHEAYIRQQKEIDRLESLIEKFRYKSSKAAFAQSKIKYLQRMDRIEDVKSDQSRLNASFSSARKGGERVLEVDQIEVGYSKERPLTKVSFQLMRGDRLAIVGPNGIGKSTLLKTLMDRMPALSGQWHFGHQVDTGYFDQDSSELKSNRTVIDELWDENPDATQTEIRSTLARFLFTGEEVFKQTMDISGGERVCLALAKLMMDHDNLLVLDEPTNHLDIPAREALENALKEYDGTILFVSHDRMFLSKMANRILEIDDQGKSHLYMLNYNEYSERKKAGTLVETLQDDALKKKTPSKKNTSKSEPASQSLSYSQRNSIKNRVANLEKLLEKADEDLENLEELRYNPEYYQDYRKMEELEEQIDDKKNEIERLSGEWEEKSLLLES
ncbi:ABC-F family ATP-binding cassette domain-containing protein [Ileibacterium valens]|uniref:ABC-F family ATP-binding cassette domain-containing protein n=1 Tax=Ileibacterium valens TaxID=1862668 RepID=UPI0025729984|nr:ABC-F family ATP-binding cassette domain-containing protein [Ileibacterium valens]